MFETGIRQLRMVTSVVRCRPLNVHNLELLIDDALETLAAFGSPGDDVDQLLGGPFADPESRQVFQARALGRTARRLARSSPYYRRLFAVSGFDPTRFTLDDMASVPVTTKHDLMACGEDFVVEGSKPFVATRTTGTTGQPVMIWLSRYEVELWPAISALGGLLRGEISPDDCMQINVSSRATAAVLDSLAVCRLVGARARAVGVVPADESIDSLLEGGERAPTLLTTYPSYLGELVCAARRRGLEPTDFRLRRIDCGGEVLSSALASAATATFGARVNDSFGMTETLPVSGRVCSQRHLHHDPNMGYVEVVDLDSGRPVAPGQLGTVLISPYFPYRECMPVFRYDTRDLVRRLPDVPLHCELAAIPATSPILGKADQLLWTDHGTVTRRDLVEAVESFPSSPWPARFTAAVTDGRLRVNIGATSGPVDPDALSEHFRNRGLHVDVRADESVEILPLRSDLLETTFSKARPEP